MEIASRPHARNLVRFGAAHPEVVVLSADLTASCEADDFRDAFPARFFSMGMAEQNMMGFAAGLAREGFAPLVHTFGVFVTRRPFDQVAMSIAYPNLPVRLFGFLPGITTPGGATHQPTDDVALMRALPNMTVLECGDATEVDSVLDVAHAILGPVYVRILRGEVPRLFPAHERAEAMVRESGMAFTIFRPSSFEDRDGAPTPGIRKLTRLLGLSRFQPISLRELSGAILHVAAARAPLDVVLEGESLWAEVQAAQR